MTLRSRCERLQARLKTPSAGPLTLFLRETEPGLPIGERVVWDGQGVEIVYDPTEGLPPLPPGGPHKLILGMDPDWV